MHRLVQLVRTLLKQPSVRYFIMAAFVVSVELATFAVMNIPLHISYVIATPASMAVGIILNWYLSRVFVFTGSRHKIHLEITLIVVTSLVGVGIQLAVTAACVNLLHLWPIVGKFFAIIVTFFWNFWVRKRYIFTIDTY